MSPAALAELAGDLEALAEENGGSLQLTASDAAELLAMLEPKPPAFEGWADLELMGHRRRFAHVRTVELAHRGFLELTWSHGDTDYREIYSPSAVFCMTPITEEQAHALIANNTDIPF